LGTHKCDLWQLLYILYYYGGTYFDIDCEPIVGIDMVIGYVEEKFLIPNTFCKIFAFNAFMASPPGNKIKKNVYWSR